MVAQDGHQHDVGRSRNGSQQGQTVAAVADGNRASGERGELCEEESAYAASCFLRALNQRCCSVFGEGSDFRWVFTTSHKHPGEESDPIIFPQ